MKSISTAIAIGIGIISISFYACSRVEPKKDSGGGSAKVERSSSNIYYTCKKPAGLALADGVPGYKEKIQPILKRSCTSCHGSSGIAPPPMHTYDLAKVVGQGIVDSVLSDEMPDGGDPLPQEEKDLLKAWFDGGMPLSEEATDGGGEGGEEEDVPECDPDHEALVKTEAVKACHEAGFIYDRNKQACSTAVTRINFSCDRDGIKNVFKKFGTNVGPTLDQSLGKKGKKDDVGEGYSIDQCGTRPDGVPIVFLVKEDGEAVESMKLLVRVITAKSPEN